MVDQEVINKNLQEGEYLAIQTVPRPDWENTYIKKRSFSLKEIEEFCEDENFMSDYSFFQPFQVKASVIVEV